MIKIWFIVTITFALGIKAVVEIKGCRKKLDVKKNGIDGRDLYRRGGR